MQEKQCFICNESICFVASTSVAHLDAGLLDLITVKTAFGSLGRNRESPRGPNIPVIHFFRCLVNIESCYHGKFVHRLKNGSTTVQSLAKTNRHTHMHVNAHPHIRQSPILGRNEIGMGLILGIWTSPDSIFSDKV